MTELNNDNKNNINKINKDKNTIDFGTFTFFEKQNKLMDKIRQELNYQNYGNKNEISDSLKDIHNYSNEIINMLAGKEVLLSILDSIPNGVQIVDKDGIIKYVNPAFLKIVKVNADERIGKSIFKVSSDGSIATVLKTKKPVFNIHNYPKGTDVQLISSASPIYYNEEMIGVVAIAEDVNSIIILMEKLNESKRIMKNLSEKISSLTSATYNINDLIGTCESMIKVKEMIRIASATETTVLIQGETGTGKEIIAQALHNSSLRANRPFISINCSAIPANLLESELFGHEKGSFTGAFKTKLGKFELANGGTLFLDEIGDMDIMLQSKILKAIEEKVIQRIGAESNITLDVRIISATNRDLRKMINSGQFRHDLYYRLNIWNIIVPSLKDRKDDIEELSEFLIKKICRKLGMEYKTVSREALVLMHMYDWPGNVRELENILERVIISLDVRKEIGAEDLGFLLISEMPEKNKECIDIMPLEDAEVMIIKEALKKYGDTYGAKKKISKLLGISLATLYNKINKYRIT